MKLVKGFIFLLVISSIFSANSFASTTDVRIWVKAFIPKEHPERPGYLIKTKKGTWVVKSPISSEGCFESDNRLFSKDPNASARVTVDIRLRAKGNRLQIKNKLVKIGQTHYVDCMTGKNLKKPRRQSKDSVIIGDVKSIGKLNILNIKIGSSNPFLASPNIDYEMVVEHHVDKNKLVLKPVVGYFPSFEAYYQIGKGSIKNLHKTPPHKGSTAWSLIDLGLGFNTRNLKGLVIPLR